MVRAGGSLLPIPPVDMMVHKRVRDGEGLRIGECVDGAPVVRNWEDLRLYRGAEAVKMVKGEDRREAFWCNWNQLKVNYGDNVEFQLRQEQVMLCPQTADFLYTHFTPLETRYVKGTRPELEKHVYKITEGCHTDRERVLALMRFTRDLYKKVDGEQLFYGGTEEELIKKGEQLCECLGRLMVAMCEILGIPGRIVMHVIGGHITSELYFEGKWAYVDPRCGLYYLWPDGKFASVWEIWNHPELLRAQSDEVKRDLSPRWTWEERLFACERKYFHPREINGFENYSLMDALKYNYEWLTELDVARNGLGAINRRYRKVGARVFGLDYTPPEVELMIFSSLDGQKVRGEVKIMVVPRGLGLSSPVDFYIDGEKVYTARRPPYWCFGHGKGWDTRGGADGPHRIRVEMEVPGEGILASETTVVVANSEGDEDK